MTRSTRQRMITHTLPEALAWLEARLLVNLTDAQCGKVYRTGTLMLAAADGVERIVLFSTVISLARHLLDMVAVPQRTPKTPQDESEATWPGPLITC